MIYTIKLLNKSVADNIQIGENSFGQMVTVSFEITNENYSYSDTVQIPQQEYTKEKIKSLILKKFKRHLIETAKRESDIKNFQEEYTIEI